MRRKYESCQPWKEKGNTPWMRKESFSSVLTGRVL